MVEGFVVGVTYGMVGGVSAWGFSALVRYVSMLFKKSTNI